MGAIIRKHLSILNKPARMKEIFDPINTRILTGFRRHQNLKKLLSLASFPNTQKNNSHHLMQAAKSVKKECYMCQNFLL